MNFKVGDILKHKGNSDSYVNFQIITVGLGKYACKRLPRFEGQFITNPDGVVDMPAYDVDGNWDYAQDGLERILEKL